MLKSQGLADRGTDLLHQRILLIHGFHLLYSNVLACKHNCNISMLCITPKSTHAVASAGLGFRVLQQAHTLIWGLWCSRLLEPRQNAAKCTKQGRRKGSTCLETLRRTLGQLEDVLFPVNDLERARRRQLADVARMEPAVRV